MAHAQKKAAVLPHNSAAAQAIGSEPPGSLIIPVIPAQCGIAALGAANLARALAVQHDAGVQMACSSALGAINRQGLYLCSVRSLIDCIQVTACMQSAPLHRAIRGAGKVRRAKWRLRTMRAFRGC